MSPYDTLTSLPRSHHVQTTDHHARYETPLSMLISSGAYRSVNTIGRWIGALKTPRVR